MFCVCWDSDKLICLKVIYHPLYSMNNFVTNKSKLPQDGVQVFLPELPIFILCYEQGGIEQLLYTRQGQLLSFM